MVLSWVLRDKRVTALIGVSSVQQPAEDPAAAHPDPGVPNCGNGWKNAGRWEMLNGGSRMAMRGRRRPMGLSTALYVIIALVIGAGAGWYARSARGANADLKTYKSRLPGLRRVRNRSGVLSIVLVVLALLVVRALMS